MSHAKGDPRTRKVDEAQKKRFREVLARTIELTEGAGIAYVIAGSLCSNHWGRPSPAADIDLVVAPQDAEALLGTLADSGYETTKHDPQWLFKATKDDVTIDIIFELEGALYLDDDMLSHSTIEDVGGIKLRLMSAE